MTRAIARVLLAGVKRQRNPRDYMHKRKEKDANVCRQGSRFSRSSHNDGCNDTEGYASLHPRLRATRFARAFDLSGRAAVKRVTISLSEAVRLFMLSFANVVILFY